MKQSFHLHFDRDLSKAGSAILREAVRRGLLSQHCLLYTSDAADE